MRDDYTCVDIAAPYAATFPYYSTTVRLVYRCRPAHAHSTILYTTTSTPYYHDDNPTSPLYVRKPSYRYIGRDEQAKATISECSTVRVARGEIWRNGEASLACRSTVLVARGEIWLRPAVARPRFPRARARQPASCLETSQLG